MRLLERSRSLTSAPTANLCSTGTASTVSGSGPWSWSCAGSGGGTTRPALRSNPSAPPVNGTCGSSNGASVSTAPTANLCAAGTASTVSGSGPWSWSCAGSNGGSTRHARIRSPPLAQPAPPAPAAPTRPAACCRPMTTPMRTGRTPGCNLSAASQTGRRFARPLIHWWRTGRLHQHPKRYHQLSWQARSFSLEPAHLPFIWPICPSRFRRGSYCAERHLQRLLVSLLFVLHLGYGRAAAIPAKRASMRNQHV